jgi:hypothetical protein
MAFDVFGHGPQYLPYVNPQYYSNGPDRKKGPSKCRGVVGGCYDGAPEPHDHSCCCDPCRHVYVDVCGSGHCCRCIPKAICAVFTPDTVTAQCKAKSWTMTPSTADGRSSYTFSPNGDQITLSVGAETAEEGYVGECTWKLFSAALSINESRLIDHSGAVHCQAPPDFTIEGFNYVRYDSEGTPSDCYGTITFTEKTFAKVPFVYRWQGQEEFAAVTCGSCSQICQVLCVRRGNEYESDYTRVDFLWDTDTERWNANDTSGHYITLHEEYGNCYLKLDSISPTTLQGDLVLIDTAACSIGMDLTVVDEVGDYIKISCNPCSCWRYLCGAFRCACRELCGVGVLAGELVEPFTLNWDTDALRWGDDTFSVTPTRGENGECMVSVTGFEDPVEVTETNDGSFGFAISQSTADSLSEGSATYYYFRCKNCDVDCASGTCLSECEDVPSVLYAELSAAPWTEMLGCNPAELCFETITFPLVQVFVSTIDNPAGEWRWIGSAIISCKNCIGATRKNYLVSVDIGCDGAGTFSVYHPDASAQCSQNLSFTLPCDGSAPWDFTFGPYTDCDGLNGCCDEGGFILGITE